MPPSTATPHYVHALYDTTMLEEPEHNPDTYKMVQPNEDADWYAKSNVDSGEIVKSVTVAYSNSLQERSPAVASFLANIDMDAEELSKLTYAVVVEGNEIADVAETWVAENGQMVDAWLGLN